MPSTPNGLPYPLRSDPPDGATQIEQLAQAIDPYIGTVKAADARTPEYFCSMTVDEMFVMQPSVENKLPWKHVIDNNKGMWTSGDPTKIVCKNAGIYVVNYFVHWHDANFYVGVPKGSTLYYNGNQLQLLWKEGDTVDTTASITGVLRMLEGDYLEAGTYHNGTGSGNIGIDSTTRIEVARLPSNNN